MNALATAAVSIAAGLTVGAVGVVIENETWRRRQQRAAARRAAMRRHPAGTQRKKTP